MPPGLADATFGASPIGSFPEIDALYAPDIAASTNRLRTAGDAYNTGVTMENQKAAEAAALKAQEAKTDPSKYQRLKKSDGGYSFIDPTGKEISAYEYANVLGKNPSDVLSDSENPIDIGYQQDFKNLNDYLEAKLNSKYSDEDKQLAQQIENQVREQQGVDLAKMNINDVIKRFKEAYPTVYGGRKPGVQAGTTLIPYQKSTQVDPLVQMFQQQLQGQ